MESESPWKSNVKILCETTSIYSTDLIIRSSLDPRRSSIYYDYVFKSAYQVGSGKINEMSPTSYFKTTKSGVNWSPRFCVYGDLGLQNAQSLPRIQNDVDNGMYDVILHVGDFAYDMDSVRL